jgi:hypothetical protein
LFEDISDLILDNGPIYLIEHPSHFTKYKMHYLHYLHLISSMLYYYIYLKKNYTNNKIYYVNI